MTQLLTKAGIWTREKHLCHEIGFPLAKLTEAVDRLLAGEIDVCKAMFRDLHQSNTRLL